MKYWRIGLVLSLVIVAGATVYYLVSSDNSQTYEGVQLSDEAPDFHLTNQNGATLNLSDFRGKVVVLTFMDSKCTDTCPLTAVHFREVYRQLTKNEANQVVFLGVNVNVKTNAVADVLEATHAWHMDEIPSWHFLTGEAEVLEPIWKDYGITVQPLPDGSEIMHTPGTFLIDPSGQKRWYVSTAYSEGENTEQVLPLSDLLVKYIREILRDN